MFHKPVTASQCQQYEIRLEDYLNGAPDHDLQQHLDRCANCRHALDDSRLAGSLLRQAWDPATEPHPVFLAGVMARIQDERTRLESPAAFWSPLEFLASRLSLTAAMLLLALSVYLVGFAPRPLARSGNSETELTASDFPQPSAVPVSNEEILQTILERRLEIQNER